jgi:predicted Zn-dependent protease
MRKVFAFLCAVVCFSAQAAYLQGQTLNIGGIFGSIDNALSSMDGTANAMDGEFTLQDEYYLGRAVAANILAVYKPYTQNPELTQYLNRICQTIVINSSRPVLFNGYHVMILDSSEYNAFASPGGHIFITKKLVETAASEDMLAAIIAHEVAHIILKHSIALIEEMRFTGEMSTIAGRAANIAGAGRTLGYFRDSVSTAMDVMMKNGYSRAQEFNADWEAMALLTNSGYNPTALVDMLKILQRVQRSQSGGFNTTHPSPAERIAHAEKLSYRITPPDTSRFRLLRFTTIMK